MQDNFWGVGTMLPGGAWMFEGLFDSEEKAIDNLEEAFECDTTDESIKNMYLIYPITLNDFFSSYDILCAEILYRPLAESKEAGRVALEEYKESVLG